MSSQLGQSLQLGKKEKFEAFLIYVFQNKVSFSEACPLCSGLHFPTGKVKPMI